MLRIQSHFQKSIKKNHFRTFIALDCAQCGLRCSFIARGALRVRLRALLHEGADVLHVQAACDLEHRGRRFVARANFSFRGVEVRWKSNRIKFALN